MSSRRFWQIRSNLHVVDMAICRAMVSLENLDVLCRTILSNYSPGQELSVDEAMIKYKGHIRG